MFDSKLNNLLDSLNSERDLEIKSLKNNEKVTAGFFCNYTPPEIIEACGAIPIRILKGIDHKSETSGRRFIQRDSCSYCKASLGSIINNGNLSCIIAGTTCDQMRRLQEVIADKSGLPVFLFSNPRTFGKESTFELYKHEIQWIIDELTNLTGQSFSHKALFERIKSWNKLRSFLNQIHNQRKENTPLISGSEFFKLVKSAYYLGPEKFLNCASEIRQLLDISEKPIKDKLRIFYAGSIQAQENDIVLELIEEDNNAVIISDNVCTGVRSFYEIIPEEGDVFNNICSAYHHKTACPQRKPNNMLYDYTKQQIEDFNAQGIIYRTLKFCHPWTFEVQAFRKEFDIPLLHLDTDYSSANSGQLRTRIQAFFEMIKAKNSRQ